MEKWTVVAALILLWVAVASAQNQDCADAGFAVDIRILLSGTAPLPTPSIMAPLGGPLTLSCSVVITGQSPPRVTFHRWYHRGEIIAETGPTISVGAVEGSDGGEYQCRATAETCITELSPIFTVTTAPDMMIVEPDGDITINEREPFTLNCNATGWPVPTIQWTVAGNQMEVGSGGVYTVDSARVTDAGTYTCRAANGVSTVAQSRVVRVIALPSTANPNANAMATDLSNVTMEPFNSTDPNGFYIAVGVTAGVGLILGIASLICCIVTLYINCCYTGPEQPHDIYDDWPDGEEGQAHNPNAQQPGLQQPEEGEGPPFVGGAEGVTIPADQLMESAEPLDTEQEEEGLDEGKRLAASPSEVGQII